MGLHEGPRVVVAGNSLGGLVARRLAVIAPPRVERLIPVDAAGPKLKPASVPLGLVLARPPGLGFVIEHLLPRPMVAAGVGKCHGGLMQINGRPERCARQIPYWVY